MTIPEACKSKTEMMITSIRDIAKATGFAPSTVSRALHGHSIIRSKTQALILRKANELGYKADPNLRELMSSMRTRKSGKFRGNLAAIWFDQGPNEDSDPRFIQVRQGIMERANVLGYKLNEFNRKDQSPESLSKVIWSRGIQGVLMVSLAHSYTKPFFRFKMDQFACVSIGWGLVYPVMHSVRFDYYQGMKLALHHAGHAFRQNIAAIWDSRTDRRAQHMVRASFLIHHPGGPSLAEKLFLDFEKLSPKITETLFRKYDIRCLIIEPSVRLPEWIYHLIPPQNIIFFKNPQTKPCFGWIDAQMGVAGQWGVDLLTTKLLYNEYGSPRNHQVLFVPPHWTKGLH